MLGTFRCIHKFIRKQRDPLLSLCLDKTRSRKDFSFIDGRNFVIFVTDFLNKKIYFSFIIEEVSVKMQ